MDVKLLLFLNCAVAVFCQSTISNRNDITRECEMFEEATFQTESIRRLLMNQQQAPHCNEMQAIQEIKSQVEEIRRETEAIQDMKQQIAEIRQIVLTQQRQNESQTIQQIKSQVEDIRSKTQAIQEIKSQVEVIRQFALQQQNRPRKECPFGFEYLPEAGRCFKMIFESLDWYSAKERCRQVMPGVHLAAIASADEDNAIARYLQQEFSRENNVDCSGTSWIEGQRATWIGGQTKRYNRCGDPFVWKLFTGIETPFRYTNWKRGEPNCNGGTENCVMIVPGYSYTWNDSPCSAKFCAICEF